MVRSPPAIAVRTGTSICPALELLCYSSPGARPVLSSPSPSCNSSLSHPLEAPSINSGRPAIFLPSYYLAGICSLPPQPQTHHSLLPRGYVISTLLFSPSLVFTKSGRGVYRWRSKGKGIVEHRHSDHSSQGIIGEFPGSSPDLTFSART